MNNRNWIIIIATLLNLNLYVQSQVLPQSAKPGKTFTETPATRALSAKEHSMWRHGGGKDFICDGEVYFSSNCNALENGQLKIYNDLFCHVENTIDCQTCSNDINNLKTKDCFERFQRQLTRPKKAEQTGGSKS